MTDFFTYPARLKRDRAGRYTVNFADLPEALTDGATEAEALEEAADCLNEAVAARLRDGEPIPDPSVKPGKGWRSVALAPELALKVALKRALTATNHTVAGLARALSIDHKEARRLIDPRAATKLPRLAGALDALGYGVTVGVFDRRRGNIAYNPNHRSRAAKKRARG